MTEAPLHSLVIASDYRVDDPDNVWPLLQRRRSALADIGAHHVGIYRSTTEAGRVLVTIGVRNRQPILDLLRSRVFFDWFDAVGVVDIPAIFAGERVETLDLTESDPTESDLTESSEPPPPGVMVSAIASVPDVSTLIARLPGALAGFRAAGIRKLWIFQAFDDAREVLILHEIADEDRARRWVERPDPVAEWMRGAQRGAYPPVFVGKFLNMLRIPENP
jgi:hypothetical protein